jgi:hypothetical protein
MGAEDIRYGIVANEKAVGRRHPKAQSGALKQHGLRLSKTFGLRNENHVDQDVKAEGSDVAGLKGRFPVRDDAEFKSITSERCERFPHTVKGQRVRATSALVVAQHFACKRRITAGLSKERRIDERFRYATALIQFQKTILPPLKAHATQSAGKSSILGGQKRLQRGRAIKQGFVEIEKDGCSHAGRLAENPVSPQWPFPAKSRHSRFLVILGSRPARGREPVAAAHSWILDAPAAHPG